MIYPRRRASVSWIYVFKKSEKRVFSLSLAQLLPSELAVAVGIDRLAASQPLFFTWPNNWRKENSINIIHNNNNTNTNTITNKQIYSFRSQERNKRAKRLAKASQIYVYLSS